ncbi:MAG: UMP kinase [Candidatus Euphemobacter frigidus]|nr:UMP kinase [Candidatus Euphemobacter frigidus]MDP8276223.1 UMP kinase [Candidatus Euphemobacter frigidus]
MTTAKPVYKRVILKISGETLGTLGGEAIDPTALLFLSGKIKEGVEAGVQLGIVCGGGNIIRGKAAEAAGLERTTADQMGMLATVVNSLAIRDVLEKDGVNACLFSSLPIYPLAESYLPRRARQALDRGEVAIFSGGTGNPFVSTDTAAVLRASDVGAGAVLKATKVDGIYTADPKIDPSARKYDRISYDEALERDLGIMDSPAIALARENHIPVIVFDFWADRSLRRVIMGEKIGTLMGRKTD